LKAKLITTFSNNLKHHEGLILRSMIALKLMFKHHINIIVVSDMFNYIETLCSPFGVQSIVSIVPLENMKLINVNDYTAILYESNIDAIKKMTEVGVSNVKKIQPIKSISLDFNSHIFDKTFTYPDLKSILEVIPKNVKLHETLPELY